MEVRRAPIIATMPHAPESSAVVYSSASYLLVLGSFDVFILSCFRACVLNRSATSQTEPEPPRELSEEEQKAADIEAIRQQGNDHYKKKEWTEALACYQEVFEKDPEQVSVLNNKVAVYMGMKDWEAAEKQCVEAIDEARKLPGGAFELQAKIYVRWGNIYKNQKDLGKAIEYYEKAQMENSTKEVSCPPPPPPLA